MRQKQNGKFWKRLIIALVTANLAVPLHLNASARVVQSNDVPADIRLPADIRQGENILASYQEIIAEMSEIPAMRKSVKEFADMVEELENAEADTPPESIPDPFHLTKQYLYVMRGNSNRGDRYHLAGTEGGLPTVITRPDSVKAIKLGKKLGIAYKDVVHVFEDIEVAQMDSDMEVLLLIDKQGQMYALDMVFARVGAFKAPMPLHKLSISIDKGKVNDVRVDFITRGFQPLTHAFNEDTGEIVGLEVERGFVAGDAVLWQKINGKHVLLDIIPRDYIVAEINNGNLLLAVMAKALRNNRPKEITESLQDKPDIENLDEKISALSTKSKQALQTIEARRVQRILLEGVVNNNLRDSFTYTDWQRDYLTIKNQAISTIATLEEELKKSIIIKDLVKQNLLETLRNGLRVNDFSSTWYLLSEKRVEKLKQLVIDKIITLKATPTKENIKKVAELEKILADQDYKKLWDNPSLYVDSTSKEDGSIFTTRKINRSLYQALQGKNLKLLTSNILGITTLTGAGLGLAYALKTGFSVKHLWPNVFRQRDLPARIGLTGQTKVRYQLLRPRYRRYVVAGIVIGLAMIPIMGIIASLSASATGKDWDFRKQINLMGMKAYAAMSLPFWHYLSKLTGQNTLLPALASGISPTTRVDGNSPIGREIGLKPDESVRVGINISNPFSQKDEDVPEETIRRKAILALQQQRVRAQGIGWELARLIIIKEFAMEKGKVDKNEIDAFHSYIKENNLKEKWKRVAVGLEKEVIKLYTQKEIYDDLRAVTAKQVWEHFADTYPQKLTSSYYENILRRVGNGIDNSIWWFGKSFSTYSTEYANYLNRADPDDFVSSMVWSNFMIDFFTVIAYEGTLGARSKVFGSNKDLSVLLATKKFPFLHREHTSEVIGQLYAYNIAAQGLYSLVYGMLQGIKEENYQPINTLYVKGEGETEGFLSGMFDATSSLLDVTNVPYGKDYIKQLSVALQMLQLGLLYSFIAKPFIARKPMSAVLPMWLYSFVWAGWAFSYPWILYYSSSKHRKIRNDVGNNVLLLAKLDLQKALDNDDAHAIQEAYINLTNIHKHHSGGVSRPLMRVVQKIEDDLQISDDEKLNAKNLSPYMGILLQIKDEKSRSAQRELYRQLVKTIESGEEYPVTKEEALKLLTFTKQNPPLPSDLNPLINFVGLGVVAIITTVLASPFIVGVYKFNHFKETIPFVLKSAAIYTTLGVGLTTNNIDNVWSFTKKYLLGYPDKDRVEEKAPKQEADKK